MSGAVLLSNAPVADRARPATRSITFAADVHVLGSGAGAATSPSRTQSSSCLPAVRRFHHGLLKTGWRRRLSSSSLDFHEATHKENSGAPHSIHVFKGEAKDILRGIFLMLLLRFALAVLLIVVIVSAAGTVFVAFQHPQLLQSFFTWRPI